MPERKRYRTVWISDVHLGSRDCRVDFLLEFLDSFDCDTLYLVGDIIDIEQLERRFFWPAAHTIALQKLLGFAGRGTRVIYIPGNHDDNLRGLAETPLGPVEVAIEHIHETSDGRRLLVLHGDRFDAVIRSGWLAHFAGSSGYRVLVNLNRFNHWISDCLGRPYWSLAEAVKSRLPGANRFIDAFREACLGAARDAGLDGVVCGHVHRSEILEVDGLVYCNDGDWVESCSAVVESDHGRLTLCRWVEARAKAGIRLTAVRDAA